MGNLRTYDYARIRHSVVQMGLKVFFYLPKRVTM